MLSYGGFIAAFEERFCTETAGRLPPATLGRLETLLSAATEGGETAEPEHSPLQQLKTDPGRVGLDNALEVISKLQQLRQLNLPQDFFRHVAPRLLQRYRQRAAVENAYEIRRHPASLRYSLIAAYCWLRAQEITDDLIESLIQIIHRIGATAERRVERELLGRLKQVSGKNTLLCRLAETALANPDGIIREVLFPVVDEQTLANMVKELKSTGPAYRQHVSTVMRASYSHHYNARTTDPLYKHIPFYLTWKKESKVAFGADCTFDLGRELDNCHGHYRYFVADYGDLDYYFIAGATLAGVVRPYTWLTGRPAFTPKWGLGYSGSTMTYTDSPDAQERLTEFLTRCEEHDILCDSFHLSSGYTSIGAKRYVFNWDWNSKARIHGFGDARRAVECKTLQTLLMMRASRDAQRDFAPANRPFLVTRSGTVGMHRYVQTWSGDNYTSWETLRYNIKMGIGLALSGVSSLGHDVGGFSGPPPDPELFLRWVQFRDLPAALQHTLLERCSPPYRTNFYKTEA